MTGRWLDEVEGLAHQRVPPSVLRYVAEGAGAEISVREAVVAWDALRIVPRLFRDVSEVDARATLLGRGHSFPVGVAPMTLQMAAHPDGEAATAAAAHRVGVPVVVSSNAGSTFADVGATGADWWLQVYVPRDRSQAEPWLAAAVAAGASAVVLTADTPVVARRHVPVGEQSVWDVVDPSWIGSNLPPADGLSPAQRTRATDLGPDDVGWLAAATGLPVVVKGVLHPADARACVDAGAAAVWVSNHGGRQLDQVVATAHALAAVRSAVGEDAEVYVDGGLRTGTHVLLALALGADAAFVGRPAFHALAADGPDGVARALAELGEELVESMRLAGCPDLASTRGIEVREGLRSPS